MAPLPPFSRTANEIGVAISEGRSQDALRKLVGALRSGNDRATRLLAANWIETVGLRPGDAKALRKGQNELPDYWLEIAEMVGRLQDEGHTRDEADRMTARHYGYSKRHVENCVARWHEAEREAREIE